ncbi:MAG: DNA-methyltransferase [Nocardioidaceae bacterium]
MIVRCAAGRLPLRDESVDLIVTSPPYWGLRSYEDGDRPLAGQIGAEADPRDYLDALWAVTAEMVRVLRPTGSLFVNLGDKYAGSGGPGTTTGLANGTAQQRRAQVGASYRQGIELAPAKSLLGLPWRYALGCIDRGLILRAEIIWSKPNGMPESVADRARRSHETWFHLTKAPVYFADIANFADEYAGDRTPSRLAKKPGDGKHAQRAPWAPETYQRSRPGSVWTVPTEPLTVPAAIRHHYGLPEHYAAFPSEWPRRLILGWCPPGGIVLDPFGGTGTTAMVARMLGRVGISADLSAAYCRLARWRIYESGHAGRAESRTWGERQEVLALAESRMEDVAVDPGVL